MAHHSRLAGFIIDSRSDDLDTTARFWSAALGLRVADPDSGGTGQYAEFAGVPGDLHVEVQKVDHPSRVHLDIETDDIDAEVTRPGGARRHPRRVRQTLVGDAGARRPTLLRGAPARRQRPAGAPPLGLAVHPLGIVDHHAVAPAGLGPVQRLVGALEDLLGQVPRRVAGGDAG